MHKKFTENETIISFISQIPKKVYRYRDAQGLQYVDLVQEGGSPWDCTLVTLVILEQAGIRFMSLAGASAGYQYYDDGWSGDN